jgi:hypothetical protein
LDNVLKVNNETVELIWPLSFSIGGFEIIYVRKHIAYIVCWGNYSKFEIDCILNTMVPKLSGACYAVRAMYHISNINTLKSIYFAYFHSVIKYGIIFWGNSSNSKKIFTLQKKIIRIMVSAQPRTPYRSLFKKLVILPIPSHYIFSLMNFILNNQENFQTNSSVHSIDTRNKHHLHRPNANQSCFQKSTFSASIRIFNRLPLSLISLKNEKTKFKVALRKYLNTHSFYSVDEFFYV